MKIFLKNSPTYSQIRKLLSRSYSPEKSVQTTVSEILHNVKKHGDKALIQLTKKFGGPSLTPSTLRVPPAEIATALATLNPKVRRTIQASHRNVSAFASKSLRKTWFRKNSQGAIVGERFDPFQRVGIYVPGGTAPLVSTAIMTCTLAQTAGVPEIVAVTPADQSANISPHLLAALSLCGATEIYRLGGAQAIAALAFGTKTIRPVQKIFGPGNPYVVEAKRQTFGHVAVDLLPGPSEILVIADDSARPDWIAADLLAQCEHGHGSLGILLATSPNLIHNVAQEIQRQLRLSSRKKLLTQALKNTALIEVTDLDHAACLANEFAAEHVSIATKNPGELALKLTSSGAIFLGPMSPVAVGDFLAGPSHELPTGGAGKSFAGLTADQFQRRTSILLFDKNSLKSSLPHIETFSEIEGLDAHARSVAIRLQSL